MSATDEPRAMSGYPHTLRPELHKALEDAGIDYWVAQGLTLWNCEDGRECVAYGYQTNDGPKLAVKIVGFTSPAQVIAATLGTGVCRNAAPNYLDFLCSECGFVHYHSDENDSGDGNEWNYCPNCERRIEVTA